MRLFSLFNGSHYNEPPKPITIGKHQSLAAPRLRTLSAATAVQPASTKVAPLKGVVVAEFGPFKRGDRRGQFDDASLESIVREMKKNDATGGTLCDYGHDDELGAFLGRIKSPRLSTTTLPDGTTIRCVRGDLHFAAVASRSPKYGDLAGHVSDSAAEDDRSLMLSLDIWPEEIPVRGQPPIWRAITVGGCDIVRRGAATTSILAPVRQTRLKLAKMREMLLQLNCK